jgi:type I restriction enzyme S subunit
MREYIKHPKLGKIPSSWKGSKLSEIVDLEHGFQFRKEDFTDSGIPVIKINNIIGNDLNLDNLSFIEPSRLEEFSRFLIKKNDILMSLTGNIGRVIEVGLIQRDFVQNYRVGKFVPVNRNELYNRYIKYLLSSPLVLSQFFKFSNQSAQANFGKQDMDKVWVAIPTSLPEQQKIAEILSTVDAKIEIIDQQISETQELKKGLMQQLLTKGIGHTEFKDSVLGKIPKSWEVVKISKVAHINNSSLPNTTDEKYEFYYIDLSSVKSGKIETPLEKIKYSDSPSRARRILKRGDVIMATVRPNLLGFAFAGFDTNNYVCSTGFALLSHKENSNGQFIYQNLYSESVKSQINKLIVGSNYPAINSSDVKNIRIPFPSLNEQNQIAEILTSVDDKLEVLSEKKTTYKELKQGLMQQLLTGRVRV